jgi:2-keto-4-pentenoate hydratase/2-oxohepta-3-ene-1,7-dioic acid hydratase in catechol pathway
MHDATSHLGQRAWSLAGAPWAIASYRRVGDAQVRAGALRADGAIVGLGAAGDEGVLALLARWEDHAAALRALDVEAQSPIDEAQLDLVLRYPPKIICAGANYHGHLAEMGVPSPTNGVEPFFFLKPPSTTVIGPGTPIAVRVDDALQLDWEAELGVVIGRRAAALRRDEAMDVVAGYIALNDVTNRAALQRETSLAPPFAFDWVRAKGLDASCPLGPGIVPRHHVGDAQDLRVRTWVNGALKQDSRTGDMVHDIPMLICAASHTFTLEPGDVLATGTPAGVGKPRGEFLAPGDVVTVEIEHVGSMSNRVEARQ